MTFIAERDRDGHWSCRRSDRIGITAGGDSSTTALERCCEIYLADASAFNVAESTADRVLYRQKILCPQCAGSGEYVGLAVVEACSECAGTGLV